MKLLLVEDNIHEADLIIMELRRSAKSHNNGAKELEIDHVETGDEAFGHLVKAIENKNAPQLVILDLNLPGMDGFEVLKRAREDLRASFPIIVLSTSQSETDVKRVYELGASCYVPKPVDLKEYRRVTSSVVEFWYGSAVYA